MFKLPKDCNARVIGAKARQLVHYSFDVTHWDFHEYTGTDHGVDCVVELIENEEWHNKKIEGQIKGTRRVKRLQNGKFFSLPIDIKTINYGLSSSNAFVLFYVDVDCEVVYYLPIQDYFIAAPDRFDKLVWNKETINVHISCDNVVGPDDYELQELAKSVYIDGPTRDLKKVSNRK